VAWVICVIAGARDGVGGQRPVFLVTGRQFADPALCSKPRARRLHPVRRGYEDSFGAGGSARSRVASASDRLLGLDGARRIRDGIDQASYPEIPTDLGHRAARLTPGTPETAFIERQIRAFSVKVE
jgi:hypothetical protein